MSSEQGVAAALAANLAAVKRADLRCLEASRRFDACVSHDDVMDVLDWMHDQDFFFASDAETTAMREAYDRADARTKEAP